MRFWCVCFYFLCVSGLLFFFRGGYLFFFILLFFEPFSPRSRICPQEWQCKDKHSLKHLLPFTRAYEEQYPQLTKYDHFVYLCSFCAICWWETARKLGRFSSGLLHVGGLLVETSHVVIADIRIQAIDIFFHGPQSAHKKDIVNIHSHIHSHKSMHTPQKNKKIKNKNKTKKKQSKILHSPNMMLSFAGPLPVQCGGGRRPGRLAPAPQDSYTVEAFLPRTVLTQNCAAE